MAEYMETEYIKKPILKIAIKSHFKNLKYQGKHTIGVMDANADINRIISEIPAADVVEVKHGEWEENRYAFCNVCSECGTIVDRSAIKWQSGELNFCPNCGAKMDGEHNER